MLRNDDDGRGVVALDVVHNRVRLVEVSEDVVEIVAPELVEGVATASVAGVSNRELKRPTTALWVAAKRSITVSRSAGQCSRKT